jgi:hypothetical protein
MLPDPYAEHSRRNDIIDGRQHPAYFVPAAGELGRDRHGAGERR